MVKFIPSGVSSGGSPNAREEVQFVLLARSGDRQAFAHLVNRYHPSICAFTFALTGSVALSEDLAQETFLEAWYSLAKIEAPEKFRAWIYAIARNVSRYDRRRGLRAPGLRDYAESRRLPAAVADLASSDPSPLERLINSEEEALLRITLARIPEDYRVPLVLFYREGQSIEEVAEQLALTTENARKRISRGRRMLHDRVVRFVESAIATTRPKPEVAAAVIVALSMIGGGGASAGVGPGTKSGVMNTTFVGAVAAAALAVLTVGLERPAIPTERPAGAAAGPAHPPPLSPAPVWSESLAAGVVTRAPKILSFDFEDGILPPNTVGGAITACPKGSPSVYCMLGTLIASGSGYYLETGFWSPDARQPLLHHGAGLVLRFDHWLELPDAELHLKVSADNGHFHIDLRPATRGGWGHADLYLRDAVDPNNKTRLADGESIKALYISAAPLNGTPFYIDNVEIADIGDPTTIE